MSLFGASHPSARYGVVIDIGSGSVLVAIVHSDPRQPRPTIVWSHRENAPLRTIESLERSAKVVMTSLVNAAMRLDTEGRKVLYDYDPKAIISELQCGISAPWSYTVTKTVTYQQDEPLQITRDIISDLERTVGEKILSDFSNNSTLQDLGLQIIDQSTTGLFVNGYAVKYPIGQEAKELALSQTSALSQKVLLDAVVELQDKLFRQAEVYCTSFIFIFFTVIERFLEPARDVCLIDVTDEATEIAIVRDNILTYATHTSFGHFSLAREIAAAIGVPLHEAHAHLYESVPFQFVERLPKVHQVSVDQVFEAYVEKLANLFQETGDELSIPKRILLHTEQRAEPLYANLIERAVRRKLKAKPILIFVTTEVIKQAYEMEGLPPPDASTMDSALVLSAQFFHIQGQESSDD